MVAGIMSFMVITVVQRKILAFIRDYSAEHGYPPASKEITAAAGYMSTSSVQHQMDVLEARKLITRKKTGNGGTSPRTTVVTEAGRQAIATGKTEMLSFPSWR
jgi:SOS-response transcriptional repressor LexA